MSILIAGVGNIFYADDAFGVEVVRVLARDAPPGARVKDFGIRAIHLAYELLEPMELCVVVDCMARGGPPGTLYVLEPEIDIAIGSVADVHTMNLGVVFSTVHELGGRLPRTLVVGCEPAEIEPRFGLSDIVMRQLPEAVALVRSVVHSTREATPWLRPTSV